MTTELVIAVKDVGASALWYEQLLGCSRSHGGDTFEILRNKDGEVILCLHRWSAHDHPTLSDTGIPAGNGLIIYFKTGNIDTIWENAQQLGAVIEEAPHLNPNSGQREFSIRDRDNYFIAVST